MDSEFQFLIGSLESGYATDPNYPSKLMFQFLIGSLESITLTQLYMN